MPSFKELTAMTSGEFYNEDRGTNYAQARYLCYYLQERGLPGWTRKGWYSVVSVKGFDSSKDAAYQQEMKSLQAKELDPRGYKWRTVKGA